MFETWVSSRCGFLFPCVTSSLGKSRPPRCFGLLPHCGNRWPGRGGILSHGALAESHSSAFENFLSGGARITRGAQHLWEEILRPGDLAIDATCGNGLDTLKLAEILGRKGALYGFDIQRAAIKRTKTLLSDSPFKYSFTDNEGISSSNGPPVRLFHKCHSQIGQLFGDGEAKLVCFNLGYLPSGDKEILTNVETTLQAIEASLNVVAPGGLISVMSYVGHYGGMAECEAVRGLLRGLPASTWVTMESRVLNKVNAPVLSIAWKKKKV
ncbi:hypothetical protein BSKO_13768 [Bryopsis sp. KO-2023]|nr:hypothetical protein BSKO_13768 [Bryopsis sp. KO-2023]